MMKRFLTVLGCMLGVFVIAYMAPSLAYAATDCSGLTGYNIPRSECDILVDFYNRTTGSGRTSNTAWVTSGDACDWTGVDCTSITGNSYVSSIILAVNGLSGTLPSGFSGLQHMTYLDLGNNTNIQGTLPTEWNVLTNLATIYLQGNALTGTLPASRSGMTSLATFFVEGNNLNGSLPTSRGAIRTMYDFVIDSNNITGPLPTEYSTWTGLLRFSASNNFLSGTLPVSRSGWRNISIFYVDGNPDIVGTLPVEWASWGSVLTVFGVGSSSSTSGLSGTLPSAYSAWTGLIGFYVFGSQITGSLPSSWSAWTQMSDFRIEDTPIQSSIPTSWTAWDNPTLFQIDHTYVYGTFTTGFTTAWTGLNDLYLDNNCMLTTGINSTVVTWLNANQSTDRTIQKRCLEAGVSKTANDSSANMSGNLTYTLSYTLYSGYNLTGSFVLYDLWNTGLTLLSSSVTAAGTGIASGSYARYWNLTGSAGMTGAISVTAYINQVFTSGQTLSNTIMLQTGLTEVDTSDDNDSVDITVYGYVVPKGGQKSSAGGGGGSPAPAAQPADTDTTNTGNTETDETIQQTGDAQESTDTSASDPENCTDSEFNTAYTYAHQLGITTMNSCQEAMMDGTLLRKHAAKMLSEFATNVLHQSPDTTMDCMFTDMAGEDDEMQGYAKEICQLGIMGLDGAGVPKAEFAPNDYVTVAQIGTIISRMLRGDAHNTDNECRYCDHLAALKEAGIMTKIDQPDMMILRGWLLIMLERVSHQ